MRRRRTERAEKAHGGEISLLDSNCHLNLYSHALPAVRKGRGEPGEERDWKVLRYTVYFGVFVWGAS